MRVGIYNRWLATLGGGERYSLAVAEYLSRRHSVTVISHTPVSKELASSKLNLDLSDVAFVTIPDRPAEVISITAENDFFMSASYMDFFPSRASTSAFLVYFPVPLHLERLVRLALTLKRWLMVPSFVHGVISIKAANHSHLRQAGPLLRIRLPGCRRDYRLKFDLASQHLTVRQAVVSLDGRVLDILALPSDQRFTHCQIVVPAADTDSFHEMIIQAKTEENLADDTVHRMALARFEIEHPRFRAYQLLFERVFKEWGLRLHAIPNHMSSPLACLDTYDAIWAISEFTRAWIAKYWNRSSVVLYPPVYVEDFKPARKLNRILNVGRFFAGSHNKKHLTMIAVFKEMVDQGLEGWEFHLAGGTTFSDAHDRYRHQEYLQQIHTEAAGYPIVIHPDISFEALVKLYGESAIYWHASGFGESEPIKFEHFGITTVEAMASGCVPVVIGKGGQTEIIRHGQNGFLWYTAGELKTLTWQLIRDTSLRRQLAGAALRDSRYYDKDHFHSALQQRLHQIGLD